MGENNYHSQFRMTEVSVVMIISGAVLLFVMFLIFAKRQIMRFTLRGGGRRGVQSLDENVPKVLRREIERRLQTVQKIVHEPKLIPDDDKYILRNANGSLPPYYYRQRAVDDVKWLEKEISKHDGSVRYACDNLRSYLITQLKGPVNGGPGHQRLIHQFCDMYEHARHDPAEFGSSQYEAYHRMLLKLVEAAKSLKSNVGASPKKGTPTKKANKTPALLDPARLRPPQGPTGQGGQGRRNMSLGIQQQQQQQQQQTRRCDFENEDDDPFHRIDTLDVPNN